MSTGLTSYGAKGRGRLRKNWGKIGEKCNYMYVILIAWLVSMRCTCVHATKTNC